MKASVSTTVPPIAAVFFVCVCSATGPAGVLAAEKPLALHPHNPHYFIWRGEPTILITSGEHYGALLNLDFDYVRYFDELQKNRLNHTRTFSGVYRETSDSFGITDNTLAPKPERFVCPWARSETPGYVDGGNKFDVTKWDQAYFDRLRDFMTQAQKRGVVVEMNLFCPMYEDKMWAACPMNPVNNVNELEAAPREEVYTLKHAKLTEVQLAVTRKIVEELRDFDNLYFEVCNEPYFGGVTMEWQHRIIDEIAAAEKEFPEKHLISLNVANGRAKVENPHPAVSIFNFHYCVPPDTVAMNYGLNKVIGENETGFRGKDDSLYRTEAWDFLIAGGALFNNLDYSFTPQHSDGSFMDYRSPGGGSPELRRQLCILRDFLYEFNFVLMQPDNTVIESVSSQLSAYALVEPGKAYGIILHVPLPKELTPDILQQQTEAELTLKLPRGRYQAQWVNTKTGAVDKSETFDHNEGGKQLSSPVFIVDVALHSRATLTNPRCTGFTRVRVILVPPPCPRYASLVPHWAANLADLVRSPLGRPRNADLRETHGTTNTDVASRLVARLCGNRDSDRPESAHCRARPFNTLRVAVYSGLSHVRVRRVGDDPPGSAQGQRGRH